MHLPAHVTGSGPRLVLVHGFTQTSASWSGLLPRLAAQHEVIAVDAPGHGEAADLALDLPAGAAALGATGGPAVYVGYSMGGRLCLRLALDRPDLVRGLVLIGATAGIDDPAERATRRAADEALAESIEREGVGPFLARWLAQPMFAGVPDDPDERRARATNTRAGLASSLRLAGTGSMDPPWWPELAGLTMPVLAIAGADDAKFRGLAARLADTIGANADTAAVADSGHAVPLEQPDALTDLIIRFTDEVGEAPA